MLNLLHLLRDAWGVVGAALALLLAAEYLPRGIRDGMRLIRRGSAGREDPRSRADGYGGADWLPEHLAECHRIMHVAWTPYAGHRNRPFQGRTIGIDASGRRRTVPSTTDDAARRILMFGGSTLFGIGSRDAATVPSLVAAKLGARGRNVRVANCGVVSYVSAQEQIAFAETLKCGERADVAVFFHGVNDGIAALQTGIPGWPYNAALRQREFAILNRPGDLTRETLRAILPSIAKRLGKAETLGPAAGASGDDLAAAVLNHYRATLCQIAAVGADHGTACLFVWQPVLYGKRRMTAYEAGQAASYADDVRAFFLKLYDLRRRDGDLSARGDAVDLGGLLDERDEPLFLDPFHLTERGNEIVADALLPHLAALMDTDAPARA
ncbi:MAG TPA: hypothetical protein VEU47_04180 [Candidatus Cybelea sp.]|nr:hypothetical protein [Candidatus Cybelea sp.]